MRGFGFDRIAMENNEESLLGKDGGGGTNMPFLDRSKVKILLCDNGLKSSEEVFALLCKCSYQVTSVRTPRQVIDALNAEGPDIDIILSEVDLPITKGLKMLKYIMRDKELQRIPIIMMSAQDDVSVVVKCLRLGAADYLVKPLRTNELLNLWTHMWRRRRMLGLADKIVLNCDYDLVASDPSDANTNSTTLFSDDTDDKSWRSTVPEPSTSKQWEDEPTVAVSVEPPLRCLSECRPDVSNPTEQTGQISSFPKKSKLKIGESSAFITYVKSSIPQSNYEGVGCVDENAAKSEHLERGKKLLAWCKQADIDVQRHETREAWEYSHCENHSGFPSSDNGPDTTYTKRSHTTSMPLEFSQGRNSKEEQLSTVPLHPSNEAQVNVSGAPALTPLPYYFPGMMNQVVMPSSAKLYQGNLHDMPKHATSTMLHQYNSLPQCPPHVPVMTSFPYYHANVCMQPRQMHATHMWRPSIASPSSTEVKPGRVERREAALIKFRQKRKDRCFDKKIRYIKRKRLAERRPRVRGQFVRQINGVDVDLSGQPVTVDDFDDDEVEEEEDEDPI